VAWEPRACKERRAAPLTEGEGGLDDAAEPGEDGACTPELGRARTRSGLACAAAGEEAEDDAEADGGKSTSAGPTFPPLAMRSCASRLKCLVNFISRSVWYFSHSNRCPYRSRLLPARDGAGSAGVSRSVLPPVLLSDEEAPRGKMALHEPLWARRTSSR